MEKVTIGLGDEKGKIPFVSLKFYGCEGTEELKKAMLAIKDCLENNFPGIQVKLWENARKLLDRD